MRRGRIEWVLYLVGILGLAYGNFAAAVANRALEARLPITARELYARLAQSQVKVQIIDIRVPSAHGYDDAHVPGAIPLPGCDLEAAPASVRDHIFAYMPTVVVAGDATAGVESCLARFAMAKTLAGGMSAWSAANLPEDSGEYSPPKAGGGGGCL